MNDAPPDRPTVLVVEDNVMNRELLTDLLEAGGYRVVTATTAVEGIELARLRQPDLVLMDVALPGLDGLEATRRLKSDPATESIPVIAVTAHAMERDRRHAEDAGCDGYISKPIDTRTFLGRIARILRSGDGSSDEHSIPSTVSSS